MFGSRRRWRRHRNAVGNGSASVRLEKSSRPARPRAFIFLCPGTSISGRNRSTTGCRDEKRGIVADPRSGRHVQQPEGVEENHLPGGEATPSDVAAKTQQVIQEIVPAGDRCKDLPDHADVFLAADPGHRWVAILILHPLTLPPEVGKSPRTRAHPLRSAGVRIPEATRQSQSSFS